MKWRHLLGTISFLQHLCFHHHQTMILVNLDLKKVIPFNTKPPLLRTTSNSFAPFKVSLSDYSPDIQSSTYISFLTISLTSGHSTCDNLAVSLRERSAWLPLGFTPYIRALMTFSSGILFWSNSCCQIYHWMHQFCPCNLIEFYIFWMTVWKATLWIYNLMTISTSLFILFLPLAKMSLRL